MIAQVRTQLLRQLCSHCGSLDQHLGGLVLTFKSFLALAKSHHTSNPQVYTSENEVVTVNVAVKDDACEKYLEQAADRTQLINSSLIKSLGPPA